MHKEPLRPFRSYPYLILEAWDNTYAQTRSQSSSAISDVTSPVVLGSKLPLVTRIVRTGLGTRLTYAYAADKISQPIRSCQLASLFNKQHSAQTFYGAASLNQYFEGKNG